MSIEKFQINISDEALTDLADRLKSTKWARSMDDAGWNLGTNKNFLKSFISYWRDSYDWKAQEKMLNEYPQFMSKIDDADIHFYHIKGKGPNPVPLILSHGWPDSFLRYQKIIPLLTDPERFDRSAKNSFDLIIPSLPGFGFSTLPETKGISNAEIADLWKKLMVDELGYDKFGAIGGDMGSGVTRYLAYNYPEHIIGIHLTDVGIIRDLAFGNDATLSPEEKAYKQNAMQWISQEGGYMSIQSTKPQTLSYALSDSPVGLAAWILEKFYSWSDCDGNLEIRFTKDELLNNIMIYWLTNSVGGSIRMYYENTHSLPKLGKIEVPTGLAIFPKDVLIPPKSWVENNLNLIHWTEMEEGGHFTAMEAPEAFAKDVIRFYEKLKEYPHSNC